MATETISCDVVVIGAGAIGLAVAARLSANHSVIVVERFPQFGRETSSRNSEVIHSGIYYPPQSNKTKWCIQGREQLYRFCRDHGIPFARTGKFVVATNKEEEAYIEMLAGRAESIGVPRLRMMGSEIQEREPLLSVSSGVYFPDSGIIDSHALMAKFEKMCLSREAILVYEHVAKIVEKNSHGWTTHVESREDSVKIESRLVVNAAGLGAAELSNLALETKRYEHRFCRGRYFTLASRYTRKFKHLIYPVPQKDGLGVHITIDLAGAVRLGPDVDWSEVKHYSQIHALYDCDWKSLQAPFCSAVQKYFPSLEQDELSPGLIGVRPKLFIDGQASSDFLVEQHGGFVHCLGIESPGLTASLRIAEEVAYLVKETQ